VQSSWVKVGVCSPVGLEWVSSPVGSEWVRGLGKGEKRTNTSSGWEGNGSREGSLRRTATADWALGGGHFPKDDFIPYASLGCKPPRRAGGRDHRRWGGELYAFRIPGVIMFP